MVRCQSLVNLNLPFHQLFPSLWPKVRLVIHQESQIVTLLLSQQMPVRKRGQIVRPTSKPRQGKSLANGLAATVKRYTNADFRSRL